MLLNLLPNGHSTKFYSIGPWRIQHPDWFKEDLAILLDLLEQGKIKPIIAMRLPLNEARRAHEIIEQAVVQGKIILDVSETS